MLKFPDNFLWGAATSAHQVEGNNTASDWWEWEIRRGLKDLSGQACRSYDLYKEDFDLAKELHHNCHRLSVEWSRIEPKENHFSQEAINHYIDVINALRERGLEPIVTLHHFTNPLWLAQSGGWLNKDTLNYFSRYVKKVIEALSGNVRFWVTINEPLVYAYHAYILGQWPPQEKSIIHARTVEKNLLSAHIEAYKIIHDSYKSKGLPRPMVSIAKNTQAFVPCVNNLRNKIAVHIRDRYYNLSFIEELIRNRSLDFIGINYYSRNLVHVNGWGPGNFIFDGCRANHSTLKKNSMGWDIYPEGIYALLMKFKKYKLPLFILENGICTDDDDLRWEFIYEHLKNVQMAMQEGAPVLGFVYWSLLDNYEWDKGFAPRFGLIHVDYQTYKRTIRESARKFSGVCLSNTL